MSVLIQVIIVGHLCTIICFFDRPNYGATLSLRAYRRRAQDSEVKVVALLQCQSSSIVLFSNVQSNTFFIKKFLDSFPWFVAEKRPDQQIYSTLCVVRQSSWLTGLQSSFIIWTLLRCSFTGCNPESAILISLKLLHCISSFDGDLFLVSSTTSILSSWPYLVRARLRQWDQF